MFKCTIWLDAACLSSTLCESEAISQLRDVEYAGGIAESRNAVI